MATPHPVGDAAATFTVVKRPVPVTPTQLAAAVHDFHDAGRSVRLLPAAPLMHGTSAITALAMLSAGGSVVTLPSRLRRRRVVRHRAGASGSPS